MQKNKFLGSTLIVAGTTIGAGMLALPVTTGFTGFFPALALFALCWFLMLLSAFCFLDVNLMFKEPVNLISMTEKLLGPFAKGVCFVIYLMLLYALTAAYIAGSTSFFASFFEGVFHFKAPKLMLAFCLPVIFGLFVYLGTRGVDLINRLLMLGLLISFLLLVGLIPSAMEPARLLHSDLKPLPLALPLIVTSFGYHIVIPSLVTYVERDRKLLKKAIITGSVLPLTLYILWQALVMGAVPVSGDISLTSAWIAGGKAIGPLAQIITSPGVRLLGHLTVFFAITTSFLGVAMSLSDFIIDGFKIKATMLGRFISMLLTFVPPLIFVFTFTRGFILALEYGGALVAILLILFPALLAWKLPKKGGWRTPLRHGVLILLMVFAVVIVVTTVLVEAGLFQSSVAPYIQGN